MLRQLNSQLISIISTYNLTISVNNFNLFLYVNIEDMPATPVLKRLRQEDCFNFETSLGYVVKANKILSLKKPVNQSIVPLREPDSQSYKGQGIVLKI